MEDYKCEKCNREFSAADALAMHNKAKHPEDTKQIKKQNLLFSKNKKKTNILLIILGILFIISLYYFLNRDNNLNINQDDSNCLTLPANEMNIIGHKNLALHIHPELQIIINGENYFIPPNIGLFNNIMRPIHTHDEPGILHIEAPCQRNFKLEEFFEIWGKTFNNECIFEYCANNGTLKVTVNGKEKAEFQNYIMQDKDEIVIEYNSRG